jgi:small-conductance mechanosensitive channel
MQTADIDAENREATATVTTGMLVCVAILFALHVAGIDFATSGSVGLRL